MDIANNGDNGVDEGSISNKLVLGVTVALVAVFLLIPLVQAIAETVHREFDEPIVIDKTKKDYTVLLSALFGRVDEEVPEDAEKFIEETHTYRQRVAQTVKENEQMVDALYVLIKGFPKKMESEYRAEIDELELRAKRQKIAVLPYTKSDAFLSTAVVEKYNLHRSFIEEFAERVHKETDVETLALVKDQSYELRKGIALLYSRIKGVMQQREK